MACKNRQDQILAWILSVEHLSELDNGPDAFIDSAAVIANLDLVISCDTSIAHLAGALNRKTWIALKYVPHWVWMLDRRDSIWYPAVRVFRQEGGAGVGIPCSRK